MASPKKSTRKVVSNQTKSASKKQAASSAATIEKNVAKTSVKKTTKKTSAKKTVTKTKLKIANNTKNQPNKSFNEKLAKLEAFHKNGKENSLIATQEKTGKKLSLKRISVPAVLSPYRLPISIDTLAMNTPRVAGFAMVVFGAIFSFFHLSTLPQTLAALESVPHLAQTGGATTTTTNTTPSAQFSLPANPLSGTVNISIGVDLAQSVKVMAYSQADGQTLTLGNAVQQSPSVWTFNWDTTKVLDGTYNISALIKNLYGTYTEQSWLPLNVFNPVSTGGSGATTTTTTTTTTSSGGTTQTSTPTTTTTNTSNTSNTVTVTNSATLKLTQDDTNHKLDVSVTGSNIDQVRVFLSSSGASPIGIGNAYDFGSGIFKYTHDTFNLTPGTYEITVRVIYLDRQIVTKGPKSFTISASAQSPTTAAATTTTTQSPTSSTQPVTTNIQPLVVVTVPNASAAAGVVDVLVTVDHAQAVELYALSKQSLTAKYIGTARQVAASNWVLRFDTTNAPNGDYGLYSSIRNAYGAYQSAKFPITIKNPVLATTDTSTVATLKELDTKVEPLPDTSPNTTALSTAESTTNDVTEPAEIDDTPDTNNSDLALITELRTVFKNEFERLASAIRVNDAEAVEKSQDRLKTLATEVENKLSGEPARRLLSDIAEALQRAKAEVERTNKLVSERTGLVATTDSDRDGISDFDEVTLYGTDPFIADSDNDGFNDGVEILNGYNPLDSAPQVSVIYESPKETGIIREDIVTVTDIVMSPSSEVKPNAETFITGTGLPNSFVTLYIFSTPIVVTVKTEADGSWVYRFDKELEDGEHEIYAGVTDNAGRIVAKSNPLRFVKEAQAFTPIDAASTASVETGGSSSIITEKVILIVLSISVLAIGVVLIMIGMHMDATRRKLAAITPAQEATV